MSEGGRVLAVGVVGSEVGRMFVEGEGESIWSMTWRSFRGLTAGEGLGRGCFPGLARDLREGD